jgi:hypothetical protein
MVPWLRLWLRFRVRGQSQDRIRRASSPRHLSTTHNVTRRPLLTARFPRPAAHGPRQQPQTHNRRP